MRASDDAEEDFDLAHKVHLAARRRARYEEATFSLRFAGALRQLRESRGQTQSEVARSMRIAQSNLQRVELASDLRLSTLHRHVDALGGALFVIAVFDDTVHPLLPRQAPGADLKKLGMRLVD